MRLDSLSWSGSNDGIHSQRAVLRGVGAIWREVGGAYTIYPYNSRDANCVYYNLDPIMAQAVLYHLLETFSQSERAHS
jgi:hypothetical protein